MGSHGEMTIEDINKMYGTDFIGKPSSVTVSEPYKENKIMYRLYVKCGDYYFPKNFQVLDEGEKPTMYLNTGMF